MSGGDYSGSNMEPVSLGVATPWEETPAGVKLLELKAKFARLEEKLDAVLDMVEGQMVAEVKRSVRSLRD